MRRDILWEYVRVDLNMQLNTEQTDSGRGASRWIGAWRIVAILLLLFLATGLLVGIYSFYAIMQIARRFEDSVKPIPASQILRKERIQQSSQPLPQAKVLFQAADSTLSSISQLHARIQLTREVNPILLLLASATPQSPNKEPKDAPMVEPITEKTRGRWHLDFEKNRLYFLREFDNRSDLYFLYPADFPRRPVSSSIREASYDGSRWVIIQDQFYHPERTPEEGWRYSAILLPNLEEGLEVVGRIPNASYIMPVIGLHRAVLSPLKGGSTLPELSRIFLNIPFEDELSKWRLQTVGYDQLDGRDCYVVRATKKTENKEVWMWICPALEQRCIRAEILQGGVSVNGTAAQAVVTYELDGWTKKTGMLLPTRVRAATYLPASAKEYTLAQSETVEIELLSPPDDSLYRLDIPTESTYVSDNIRQEVYTLGKKVPIDRGPRKSNYYIWVFTAALLVATSVVILYLIRRLRRSRV